MEDNVLEATIKCIFNSSFTKPTSCNEKLKIIWHAGEPLAAGIEYYKRALYYINKYKTVDLKYTLAIQTNATLINQQWCDFFKAHDFEVSVSIDGPEFIHNKYRKNWQGRGSFEKVMKGIKCLADNNMPLRSISVLTNDSLDYPNEIYDFFKENGFEALCFNVDELEGTHTTSSYKDSSDALVSQNNEKKYKKFMSELYDRWMADKQEIRIREFDAFIQLIAAKKHYQNEIFPREESLAFGIITVNKEGGITTFSPELAGGIPSNPNHFVIGNVLSIDSFDQLPESPLFKEQNTAVANGIRNCARECEYFELCGGGCPSNKFYEKGTFEATETMACILTQKILIDLVIEKLSVV